MWRKGMMISLAGLAVGLFLVGEVGDTFAQTNPRSVPDPAQCSLSPWDDMNQAFVSPGNQSGVDLLTVEIRDFSGSPIGNAFVEIVPAACGSLCIDEPDNGLTGWTDVNGQLTLDPRVGGCQECQVVVRAEGVLIRSYPRIVSTDWDGSWADGCVDMSDFTFFQAVFGTPEPCADYDGDGLVTASDLARFQLAFGVDINNQLCPPGQTPDPSQSTVTPWDDWEQAVVSPGPQSAFVVEIVVGDTSGDPIPNCFVEIDLGGCSHLCIDFPLNGLTGTTNASGEVTLDPRVGGCESCPIVVKANGVVLRTYTQIVSPDWDGYWADGQVDDCDLAFFEAAFGGTGDLCADYDGDGIVGLPDWVWFTAAYGNANTNLCPHVPNPGSCEVLPWDNMAQQRAFVSPGTQSGVDEVDFVVRDALGLPIPCALVEIDLSGCSSLCIDPPENGLAGIADLSGELTLDPQVGGCENCAIVVRANGVTLRTYSQIVSPDWNGSWADGKVDDCDAAFFQLAWGTGDTCADYDGDGMVTNVDWVTFGAAYAAGDANNSLCIQLPDPGISTVFPWDAIDQVFVSPGDLGTIGEVTIEAHDAAGRPVACAQVDIDFAGCRELCLDYPFAVSGLRGTTDLDGVVVLDPRVGGCSACNVEVRVNGTIVRTFTQVVSPDWDGAWADGQVDHADSLFFAQAYGTSEPCADYDGDGLVDLGDWILFLDAYGFSNDHLCALAEIQEEPLRLSGSQPILIVPMNPVVSGATRDIIFYVPEDGQVTLKVFDVSGALVSTLADGCYRAGERTVSWRGQSDSGTPVGHGVYFLKLCTPSGGVTQKLITLR